jgi:tRNA pseudouridine38-40 synthase
MLRLVLEYDGTGFAGWQRQEQGERTVQGVLAEALRRVCGSEAQVEGAGRTDAGVHARGQVAGVRVETRLAPAELQRALNAVLPADLAVLSADPAPADWHPRRSACRKLYRYAIWNGRVRSPLRERFAHWVPQPLAAAAMAHAAGLLAGTQDFRSFQATGSGVERTVRTLFRAEVLGEGGGELAIELEGDGFLRHMVRNVAGTLIEVGLGRRPAESMPGLIQARDRGLAGPTAPARGLTLVRVDYREGDSRANPRSWRGEALDGPEGLG